MESDWVYCHFRQKKDSLNNFFEKDFVASEYLQEKSGQAEAVIEIFLLAQTKKIYGTQFSSFSRMAALIGNIPLERVFEE